MSRAYRDPTAALAISRVSRKEVTRRKLIEHCRSRPESYACDRCEYDKYCSVFIRETGHVPYTAEDDQMTDEVISIKQRRRL